MTPETIIMGAAFLSTLAFLIYSEHQQWKRYDRMMDRLHAKSYADMTSSDAYAQGIKRNMDVAAQVMRESIENPPDDPSDIGQ